MSRSLSLVLFCLAGCQEVPATWLTRVDPEPAGANCADGGLVVHEGADVDHNGGLDPEEIERSSYQCAGDVPEEHEGLLLGSYTIRTQADADGLGAYEAITGHLNIRGVQLDTLSLPGLRSVGGTVRVGESHEGTVLQSVSLPDLAWAGGGVELRNNPKLAEFAAPQLQAGGPSVQIALVDNPELSDLSALLELTEAGNLVVEGDQGGDVVLPALTRVHGAISLSPTGEPMRVELAELRQAGRLGSDGETALTELVMPELTDVDGDFAIVLSSRLETLDAPRLASVGGNFDLIDVAALPELDLPALGLVGRRVKVQDNSVEQMHLGSLQVIGEGTWISRNRELTVLDLSMLTSSGNWPTLPFAVEFNRLLDDVRLPTEPVSINAWFVVSGNGALPDLAPFFVVSEVRGDFTVKGNDLIDCAQTTQLVNTIGLDKIGEGFDDPFFDGREAVIDLGACSL